jgi:hypothetical protein
MSAGSLMVRTITFQGKEAGSIPSPALQPIRVQPIPFIAARRVLVKHHYLHSLPGGTKLAFGAVVNGRLLGAITFGSGPQNVYQLVSGTSPEDCLTLSRLWLSDELPTNSESRVIGICLRALRKHSKVKFLVSYADPSQGHFGTIYQATGWLYTGLSEAMPKFDLGDGKLRHSRSLSHAFGSHSLKHFQSRGAEVKVVPQSKKHRYIYFLDRSMKGNLKVKTLPYPKKGDGRVQGSGNTTTTTLSPCTPLTNCTGKSTDEDN